MTELQQNGGVSANELEDLTEMLHGIEGVSSTFSLAATPPRVGVPLVEKSLLLKRRVVAQEQVGLRIEDLLRELGVWVEKDLPGRVVWMPPHDPVEPHDRIRPQNVLFLLLF